jgi:putative transposase
MIAFVSAVLSLLSFRLRRRASLELEVIALRHQLGVLRRQGPQRLRLRSSDCLFWAWLYRLWPRCLEAMALVKPVTVVQASKWIPALLALALQSWPAQPHGGRP